MKRLTVNGDLLLSDEPSSKIVKNASSRFPIGHSSNVIFLTDTNSQKGRL